MDRFGEVTDINDIVREILDGRRRVWKERQLGKAAKKPQYTEAMRQVLCDLGTKRGYKCHPSKSPEGEGHSAWLWDFVWWRKKGIGLCLVAETEWGNAKEARFDFKKLLVAKSPLKLMIFNGNHSEEHQKDVMGEFEAVLRKYQYHFAGETYVAIGFFCRHPGPFDRVWQYKITSDGPIRDLGPLFQEQITGSS